MAPCQPQVEGRGVTPVYRRRLWLRAEDVSVCEPAWALPRVWYCLPGPGPSQGLSWPRSHLQKLDGSCQVDSVIIQGLLHDSPQP